MPKRSAVGKLASAATRKEFAEELSSHTTLTAGQIERLFPKKTDRQELNELIEIVTSDGEENQKKAQLAEKITNVGGAVLKIVRHFAVGI